MQFRVIKSSLDGISCGGLLSIDDACQEVSYHKGWDSAEQMRAAIRKWAKKAKPGDVFTTPASAIVAGFDSVGAECPECGSELVTYDGINGDGFLFYQNGTCVECETNWQDAFLPVDRQIIK